LTDDNFAPFSNISADSKVMEFYPSQLTDEESNNMANRVQSLIQDKGYGFWAVE
jgi:hypothetical protein